jgi:hypothetical protein
MIFACTVFKIYCINANCNFFQFSVSFETPKKKDVLDHFSKTQLETIGKFNDFNLKIDLKLFDTVKFFYFLIKLKIYLILKI